MEEDKKFKLKLGITKPPPFDPDTFNIFSAVSYGKLTAIVDHFEILDEGGISYLLAERDDKGNIPLDLAVYLGFKNIVLYFLKCGAELNSVDLKQRNLFHNLCYKRNFTTLITIQNFVINDFKERLHQDLISTKHTYGLKNIDVKQGKLIKSGYISKKIQNNFKDFMAAIESLAINIHEEYIQFYRTVLSQQDEEGRTPLHFSTFEKLVTSLLSFGLENTEGFEEFSYDCQQLKFLEDDSIKTLDPRKHFDIMNELKHFLEPSVYKKIIKTYKKDKKALIKEVLNTEDINDQTPLHIVSRRGNYVLVRFFLRLGADANLRDCQRKNPLDIAKNKYVRQALTNLNDEASKGNDKNITRLCEEGDNINERNDILGEAPIHRAVLSKLKSKVSALRTILDQDANVDLVDNNGWTALHHAAYNGEYESAVELISNGANVNCYSNSMKTPLHFAALNDHADVVNLLVTKGAKIEGISNKEIQKFAPQNSSLIMDNISPLLIASRKGHTNCFELLLSLGANLHETDVREWNCLHFAAYNGHHELVNKILQIDHPENILIKQKNKQEHLPFDICKNEKTKFYFRKKKKDDEDAIKRKFLELRKKKKLENQKKPKTKKTSGKATKKPLKEENKESDDDYSMDEDHDEDDKKALDSDKRKKNKDNTSNKKSEVKGINSKIKDPFSKKASKSSLKDSARSSKKLGK
ncbi:unnamed protein product [Moneuplotes crassus]|uniref:Ankyrin repeat protein n=2 Tax=Euplotes crassus TaxID=5936 RepID=A0AAD1U5R5_EUPCR|nr:unnamed protein product [Moneuplotes crassus]